MCQRAFILSRLSQILRRVCAICKNAKCQEHQATNYLQVETIGIITYKLYHHTHSQAGNTSIDNVTQGSAATCYKAIPSALVQCALNT